MKGFVITFTRQIASLDYCAYPATPKVRSGPGGAVTEGPTASSFSQLLPVCSGEQWWHRQLGTALRSFPSRDCIYRSLPLHQCKEVFDDIFFVAEEGKAWVKDYRERWGGRGRRCNHSRGVSETAALGSWSSAWAAPRVAADCIWVLLTCWRISPCRFAFQIWSFPKSVKRCPRQRSDSFWGRCTQCSPNAAQFPLEWKALRTFKLYV